MNARIAGLKRYRKKGEEGESLTEAVLVEGVGMEGDIHQGGERQISLLPAETRRWMENQREKGLCFVRYRENILTEGLELGVLSEQDCLLVGDAVLRISKRNKQCFSDCTLYSQGTSCRLADSALFAVVEKSGTVRNGDPIHIE